MTNEESLELDATKMETLLKKIYKLDNVVILTRKGDQLGTFCSDDPAVTRAILEVAQKFHNEGVKKF